MFFLKKLIQKGKDLRDRRAKAMKLTFTLNVKCKFLLKNKKSKIFKEIKGGFYH